MVAATPTRPVPMDSDQLDLLALWFTIVKILHATGALCFLPPLIAKIGASVGC